MKAIVTTPMHPDFEKRTVGNIIVDGVKWNNKTQWVSDHRDAVSIEDLKLSLGREIYNPTIGLKNENDPYYGSSYAYECELPDGFKIDTTIFEQIN